MTIAEITTQIDKVEFKDLVVDLLDDLVHGDTSPFKDVVDEYDEYLDNSELDIDQRASAKASFLRDVYSDINKQAISAALDILKTNEQLELEKIKTISAYNLSEQERLKLVEDTIAAGKQAAALQAQTDKVNAEVSVTKLQKLEMMAKLKKQYGYGNVTEDSLGVATNDGAVDKQIIGYDKVNYKDLLKAYNEHLALIANAGGDPSPWMINTTKLLTEMVTDGKINISGTTDSDGNGTTTVAYSDSGSTPGL